MPRSENVTAGPPHRRTAPHPGNALARHPTAGRLTGHPTAGRTTAGRTTAGRRAPGQPPEPQRLLRIWRPAGLPGVVALHGRDRAHRSAPRGELLVAYLVRGRMELVRDGSLHRMRPGELALWAPGEQSGGLFGSTDGWEARLLAVELPTFGELVDADRGVPGLDLPTSVLREPRLAAAFVRLHGILACSARVGAHAALLTGWLRELARVLPTRSRPEPELDRSVRTDRVLRTACELLRADPVADHDLGTLAEACGTSRFGLIRLFNARLGLSPQRYQIQLRVQRARALLEAGNTPSEVPHLVGFYDQSHLNRHFTRRLGVTPARYARAFRRTRLLEPVRPGGCAADVALPACGPPRPVAQVGRPLLVGQVSAEHVA